MNIVKYVALFIVLVLFQIFIGKNLIIMGTAFCFIYVLFLLMLPVENGVVSSLLLGFLIGVLIDMVYNTGGMHSAASVLVMFFRSRWLNAITPQGGYDAGTYPSLHVGGMTWFIGYAWPVIFIHHLIIFFLESYGFSFFWHTLNKALMSSIFTITLAVLFLTLFGKIKSR